MEKRGPGLQGHRLSMAEVNCHIARVILATGQSLDNQEMILKFSREEKREVVFMSPLDVWRGLASGAPLLTKSRALL